MKHDHSRTQTHTHTPTSPSSARIHTDTLYPADPPPTPSQALNPHIAILSTRHPSAPSSHRDIQ
ncbi:hypothetical protein E2C01_096519 [Portunus trituberculatus]|uniref:Uncharacterized protein n=1 Tax=Portunus trituberculatus TaxID=210409 RepID=A0A5B7K785_PORTR|nr:hypothetical protein [Portunus trituberculatus]